RGGGAETRRRRLRGRGRLLRGRLRRRPRRRWERSGCRPPGRGRRRPERDAAWARHRGCGDHRASARADRDPGAGGRGRRPSGERACRGAQPERAGRAGGGGGGMTRALITNDDGIASPGLYALAHAAREAGLEVVVAAPAEEASGSSAAITGTNTIAVTGHTDASTIKIEKRELPEVPGVPAFSVRAAPGLIALLAAHGAFGDAPELVLSGINRGANLGRVVLHSGTVGAALTGGVNDACGLAVSLDVGLNPEAHHWETAAAIVRDL